jgi:hypothetical protein
MVRLATIRSGNEDGAELKFAVKVPALFIVICVERLLGLFTMILPVALHV